MGNFDASPNLQPQLPLSKSDLGKRSKGSAIKLSPNKCEWRGLYKGYLPKNIRNPSVLNVSTSRHNKSRSVSCIMRYMK
ncbi:hypothetical protein TSMEX_005734 [Taenia solium]|eukprot:TsM_000694500 transcript=TsM_000694500 gene=TsM_000694500